MSGDIGAYFSLFASAFLAATLIPAQSESVLVYLITTGHYSISLLVAVASLGTSWDPSSTGIWDEASSTIVIGAGFRFPPTSSKRRKAGTPATDDGLCWQAGFLSWGIP